MRHIFHSIRLRKVTPSALAFLFFSLILFASAQRIRSGFEKDSSITWDGPAGGGVFGGQGSGKIVQSGDKDFVHSGLRAIRLRIWDDGNSDAVAWAGIMHTLPCERRRRVRVGAWIYFSSTIYPLSTNASAHLRVEYFEDPDGNVLIPGRVHLSPPLDVSSYNADTWHQLEVSDRIPPRARSLRVSVVLTAHDLGGKTQAVWLDDLSVALYPEAFPHDRRIPGKIESSLSPLGIAALIPYPLYTNPLPSGP